MLKHTVRALAFHHEKGYEAQRELALKFAGTEGRIATMDDIVHARLHSDINDFVWTRVMITGSYAFAGWNKSAPMLVFAHGVGPHPTKVGDRGYRISQQDFKALLDGKFGEVASVDLRSYHNESQHKDASNRYTYEVARKDPIIRAFFGRQVDAFLDHYHKLTQDWLKKASHTERKDAVLLINRIYDIYGDYASDRNSFGRIPRGYVNAYPLTLESHGLYTDHKSDKHIACGIDFSVATNSGIDDLGGSAYYIVGVRGKEPLTEVVPEFRTVVSKIKEKWPTFVQPLAEVPHDAYVGIKPDGSNARPYYLLSKWGSEPQVTGRIREDGTESTVPEFRIRSSTIIDAPPTVTFTKAPYRADEGYPYTGMWAAVLKAMPEGANAISFAGSCHSCDTIEVDTTFYRVKLDDEPFRILMKCGDRFFTQYGDKDRPTEQPHLLVAEAKELDQKLGLRIPDDVYDMCAGRREQWPILAHLIAKAPESANAMWIEKQWAEYNEKAGKNIAYASVHYYNVMFDGRAFRPFTEIRADFDWQLERRVQANLLKAA